MNVMHQGVGWEGGGGVRWHLVDGGRKVAVTGNATDFRQVLVPLHKRLVVCQLLPLPGQQRPPLFAGICLCIHEVLGKTSYQQ